MAYHNMAFTGDHTMDTLDHYVEPSAVSSAVNSSPISTDKRVKPSGSFTFVDFCPEYTRKPESWFFQSNYQTFRYSKLL